MQNTFRDRELEKWIICELASENYPHGSITAGDIIDDAPKPLAVKIPNEQSLVELLFNLTLGDEPLLRCSMVYFSLTNDGKLHFRKFLEPIQEISKSKDFKKIIDSYEGDNESKKQFKKLLNKIKDELPEVADSIVREFVKKASSEGIYFLVRFLLQD